MEQMKRQMKRLARRESLLPNCVRHGDRGIARNGLQNILRLIFDTVADLFGPEESCSDRWALLAWSLGQVVGIAGTSAALNDRDRLKRNHLFRLNRRVLSDRKA